MKRIRALAVRRSVALWAAEIGGVVVLSIGAWMMYAPAAFVVVAAYMIIIANVLESPTVPEDDDASNR